VKTARRTLIALGALGMTYAVIGALTDADVKGGALIFLIGVLIAHDGLLLPVTIGVGALAGRFTPLRMRGFVRSALIVSLAVTVVAFPLVLGKGRAADNPSLLPLHYGRGLLEVYAIIWAAAGIAIGLREWRGRRPIAEPPPRPEQAPEHRRP
jgi:hypothetical protein